MDGSSIKIQNATTRAKPMAMAPFAMMPPMPMTVFAAFDANEEAAPVTELVASCTRCCTVSFPSRSEYLP